MRNHAHRQRLAVVRRHIVDYFADDFALSRRNRRAVFALAQPKSLYQHHRQQRTNDFKVPLLFFLLLVDHSEHQPSYFARVGAEQTQIALCAALVFIARKEHVVGKVDKVIARNDAREKLGIEQAVAQRNPLVLFGGELVLDACVHENHVAFFDVHDLVSHDVPRVPVENVNKLDKLVRVPIAAAVAVNFDRNSLFGFYVPCSFQLHFKAMTPPERPLRIVGALAFRKNFTTTYAENQRNRRGDLRFRHSLRDFSDNLSDYCRRRLLFV